ncbi:MAG: hypothetical protein H0X04_04800 [Chthoniobacterales bacterium]|nr:hypothetical protein [Chthoniobacterales bacterium]
MTCIKRGCAERLNVWPTPLASWWIDHASLWFSFIATIWTAALVALSGRQLERWEE